MALKYGKKISYLAVLSKALAYTGVRGFEPLIYSLGGIRL